MSKEISCEIVGKIKTLTVANQYRKEINWVSWGGKRPSLDIRMWDYRDEENPIPLKGIALNPDETRELIETVKYLECWEGVII